jgi:hypothetical protein
MKKYFLIILVLGLLTVSLLTINSCTSYFNSDNQNLNELETSPQNASAIVIGASYIRVPENAKVITQVDRVIKDTSSNININTDPGQIPKSPNQLVPYMEGARIAELIKYANVQVIPITGVTIKNINGNWYGPDEHDNYIFSVDPSKTGPSFSINGADNTTKIEVNTHGMNVMVHGAIKNNAFLVVACGDLPGKAKAEMYMAARGINCYAPCDRFTANVMGYNGTGIILGGEPIRAGVNGKEAIIGGQPISIDKNEKIIIQTTTKKYPDQYCDTPNRYFKELESVYNVTLNTDVVDATIGETDKVVNEAQITRAKVIAVRVLKAEDKEPVEKWLKSDKNNRAIIFHSAAYTQGYSLFFEFPEQVTGQDPRPIFIKQTTKSNLNQIFNGIRSIWSSI